MEGSAFLSSSKKWENIRLQAKVSAFLPPQQMIAATNRARSLSSSPRPLNFIANWNFGSIMSLNGRRRLLRNSRVMKPEPYATRSPSLFMQEANMAKRASYTPYFKRVTWSLRSKPEKPGTDLANSVSSVTVSTDVYWQQWKMRTSASLSFSVPAELTIFATRVCSASWSVSMSWMTKGCGKWRRNLKKFEWSKCLKMVISCFLRLAWMENVKPTWPRDFNV